MIQEEWQFEGHSLDHVLPAFLSALRIQRYNVLPINDGEQRALIARCRAVRRW